MLSPMTNLTCGAPVIHYCSTCDMPVHGRHNHPVLTWCATHGLDEPVADAEPVGEWKPMSEDVAFHIEEMFSEIAKLESKLAAVAVQRMKLALTVRDAVQAGVGWHRVGRVVGLSASSAYKMVQRAGFMPVERNTELRRPLASSVSAK